jgi:hypothetical protein
MSTTSKTDEYILIHIGTTCSICQEDFVKRSQVWTIRRCAHTFHKSCIEPWTAGTCPVCRRTYTKPEAPLTEAESIYRLKMTATFAFAIKIVRSCSLEKFMNELPTIREIAQKIKIEGHSLYTSNIDTSNLHTFYESYMQLRREMCNLYNHERLENIHLLSPIQHITCQLIKYPALHALIVRCSS